MILIHGECGSGRTSALRALEAAAPPGFRAAYVPVPTLDLAGIGRWCLDRLAPGTAGEPVAALRELARKQPLLLLIDDAERLPIATAEALARLAWESTGAITVIAACETEARASGALAALGAPEQQVALEAAAPDRAEDAARAVREQLVPALRGAPATAASRAARASARLARSEVSPQGAPIAARAEPPDAQTRRPESQRSDAAPLDVKRERSTVPLGFTIAFAVSAFLVPVAFGAGLWLGRAGSAAPTAIPAEPTLPAVAAPPPATVVAEPVLDELSEPPTPAASAPAQPVAVITTVEAASAPPAQTSPQPALPLAVPAEAPRASAPKRAAAPDPDDDWGTPALISVAPGEGGR